MTADNPTGDVAFGVDNTFASRALDEGVFDIAEVELPEGAADFVVPGDDGERLVPVDTGNVCVNVDTSPGSPSATSNHPPRSTTSPTRRTTACSSPRRHSRARPASPS